MISLSLPLLPAKIPNNLRDACPHCIFTGGSISRCIHHTKFKIWDTSKALVSRRQGEYCCKCSSIAASTL